jgi:hypothetical protein
VTRVMESTDRALKVDALVTQIDGTPGAWPGFRVNGEMSSAGLSQQLELSKGSAHDGLELKPTPVPPRDSAVASHLTFSPPARGVHTS